MRRRLRTALLLSGTIMLAATLACSALTKLPNPFASPTPTATATFTPSPTPTVTPTATPRPTGVEAVAQSDGRTLVRDFDNGYTFVLPMGWHVLPLSAEDIDRFATETLGSDTEFADLAKTIKGKASDIIRMFGIATDRKYLQANNPTMVAVSAFRDPVAASLPMAGVTAMIEDNMFTGSKDTTWSVVNNAHGVEVGIVEGSYKIRLEDGTRANTKMKVIAFQANHKLITIQFMTPAEFGGEILPGLDEIIETIQLVKP